MGSIFQSNKNEFNRIKPIILIPEDVLALRTKRLHELPNDKV